MQTKLDPLFLNHLAFFDTHRGHVRYEPQAVWIDGLVPSLCSWTPLNDQAPLPAEANIVRLIPSCGASWESRIGREGYSRAEALAYMELPADAPIVRVHRSDDELSIGIVSDDDAAQDFAKVQAAAFLTQASDADWWVDCFATMAVRNFSRPEQRLYLARSGGVAAAVLLALDVAEVTGIYAVATVPHFQRRGLSTALLARALRDTDRPLILQAIVGSYAHGFYARLGFAECYRSQIWRRERGQ